MEQKYMDYFNEILNTVKHSINVRIPIIPFDHDKVKGHTNALGICYSDENGAYQITIDEYFIEECYKAEVENDFVAQCMVNLSGDNLIGVICHEIAHTHEWRHGKKHRALTERLISYVESGKPHGMDSLSA